MANLTTYSKDELIKYFFRTGGFTDASVSAINVSLHTGDPGLTGAANEVVGNGYARGGYGPSNTLWDNPAGQRFTSNANNIASFPAPSGGNWGNISHAAVWADTNPLFFGILTAPIAVNDGDAAPIIPAGTMILSLINAFTEYSAGIFLNHFLRNAAAPAHTAMYAAMHIGAPGTDNVFANEVNDSTYARSQRDPLDANWRDQLADDGETHNLAAIAYAAPDGTAWMAGQTISHFSLADALTNGNKLFQSALTSGKIVAGTDPAPEWEGQALKVIFA